MGSSDKIFDDDLGGFGVVPPVPLKPENKVFEPTRVIGSGTSMKMHGHEAGVCFT